MINVEANPDIGEACRLNMMVVCVRGLHLICIPVIHVGLLLIQIPYSCSVYMILDLKEEGCQRSTNDQETPGSYVVGSRPTSVDFKLKQGEK